MPRLISIVVVAALFAVASLANAQQDKPAAEMLQPTAGQTITGEIDVRVKLPSAQPLVYAGRGN